MKHDEGQQPGLGGALLAAYGVVPEAREVRVERTLGQLLADLLGPAGRLLSAMGRLTRITPRRRADPVA